MTLLDVPDGSFVRVDAVATECGMRSRLSAMGIYPGCELEVAQKFSCSNGVRVRVRDSSIILADSIAQNVRCCLHGRGKGRGVGRIACTEENRDSCKRLREPLNGVQRSSLANRFAKWSRLLGG